MSLYPNARSKALQAADHLPLAAVVLQRSLSLFSKGDDVVVQDIAKVLEQDVATAGSLLAIANSAFYARGSAVKSLTHAIARLGIPKTRNALLGLSITRVFKGAPLATRLSLTRFNTHSLASGILGDLIARHTTGRDLEWAFLTGLLHDIGLLLIAAGVPQCVEELCDPMGNDLQLMERETELLGFDHFDLGADLLARWNCPPAVTEAVRSCRESALTDVPALSLAVATKTASMLADACGVSTFPLPHEPELTSRLLEELKVADPVLFMASFNGELQGLSKAA